jgi:signal transduction histidine kinase
MSYLISILEPIKDVVKSGIISELEQAKRQGGHDTIQDKLVNETANLTEAVIETVRQNTFTPLKVYLSWICKVYIEQGVVLSEIMTFFDLYETSIKDAMSIYLQNDLVSLNQHRRALDTLLDKARVYLSDYFFILYEETVLKQFEQLRVINEITAQLTSSLNLNDVLNFIVTHAVSLFQADCGCILLANQENVFSVQIAQGWQGENSPLVLVMGTDSLSGVNIVNKENVDDSLQQTFYKENLETIITIKLLIHKHVIGVLVVGFRSVRKVTITDGKVLETFACQAAIAVNNAQRYGDTDNKLQERIREITVLLEQERALLLSIREGVIVIDASGAITRINSEAKRLLNISEDMIGSNILSVIPNSRLPLVMQTQQAEYDQEQKNGTNTLITNRVPILVNGEVSGAIAIFKDRQDVTQLAEKLVGVRSLLESMRAQSHEFTNKLHAIAGLIEMGQYEKVVELITDIYKNNQESVSFVVKRIKEQSTAGLLLGKISQSKEQAILLLLRPRSKLTLLPISLTSTSMVTILGNLISNAMEAVANLPRERRLINVYIFQGQKFLTISVADHGCGIPKSCIKSIFKRGFSTKPGSRGIGLALVKQEVEVSGGKIFVYSVDNQGSEFIIKIPVE